MREVNYADDRPKLQEHDLLPLGENLFFFEVEPPTRVPHLEFFRQHA